MSLHKYAPLELLDFIRIVQSTQPSCRVAKARSSHTAHITVNYGLLPLMKTMAANRGLELTVGRFYHRGGGNKCQIVVKAA